MLIVLEKCPEHNVYPEFRCWQDEEDVLQAHHVCPVCISKDFPHKTFKTWSELLAEIRPKR